MPHDEFQSWLEAVAMSRRNSKQETLLCNELRKMSVDDATRFILELATIKPGVGLSFANRVLRSNETFLQLLSYGVNYADASTIQFWIKHTITRIGTKKVIQRLDQMARLNPRGVNYALYFMQRYAKSEWERGALAKIKEKVAARIS